MQIFRQQYNNVNFKRIQLSKTDEIKVLNKLASLSESCSANKIHSLKIDLFEIFDSLFQKELSRYSSLYTHKEDFLQGVYLRFFELLNNIQEKNISIFDFFENINKIIKPNNEERKEKDLSIDRNIFQDSKITFADNLTEDRLPIYASSKNEEENKIFKDELEKISKKTILTEKEKTILELKKQGKNFEEISKIMNSARPNIRNSFISIIAKIQRENDILPEEYEKYANIVLNKYPTKFSQKEVIDVFVRDIKALNYIKHTELKTISKKAEILECTEEDFVEMALKQPSLFYINPSILKQNFSKLIKIFNTNKEKVLQMVKKLPSLLYQKPERIKENITNSSSILNINESDFIQAVLKYPSLSALKPETIKEKIIKLAKFLNIKEQEIIEVAIKDAHLFILDLETFKQNINECIKIFGISKKDFIKAALRAPNLFYQKPETLKQNVFESAKMLNIIKKEFIRAALNAPCLFYQKPTTIKRNLEENALNFNVSEKDFVKIALYMPTLFYLKPENLKQKVQEMAKIIGVDESIFIKLALKQYRLLSMKPETLEKNIQLMAKSFEITKEEFVKEAIKRPSIFCFNPESIDKKISKYKFYTKVTGKELENFVQIIRNKTDEFFERSFFYLAKNDLGNKKEITRANLIETIKRYPDKTFTFNLPEDECTEEFIQYVKDFFAKNIGTENYKFIIDGKEIK